MDLKKVDELIKKHQAVQGPLVSILHDIQRAKGSLPKDVLEHLSKKLKTPLSEIARVVTYFEKAFRLYPKGEKHTIRVCCGTTCHVMHSDEVLENIQEELIKDSKNTDFAVEEVRCLGCCTVAPAVEIDGEIVEKGSVNSTVIKLKGEIK